MAHNIVNLDDSAKAVTIVVNGESFVISSNVLKARDLFAKHLTGKRDYINKLYSYDLKREGITVEEVQEYTDQLTKIAEEYAEKKLAQNRDIMQILLEKNGYNFDWDWWLDNVDCEAIDQFIAKAMKKDEDGQPVKK